MLLLAATNPQVVLAEQAAVQIAEPRGSTDSEIEEIIVWGRAASQKGTARSASEGLVGYADFETRPLQRVGELVEVVPGMVATQHSGEGKANQYYLRGMNLDHGTDFSAFFEGMPVNFRAHAHGQGYLDLNFIVPELVETVRYAKGPYAADRGDFSTAGTTEFKVYDYLDESFIEATIGEDGYRRILSAGSVEHRTGHFLGSMELVRNDGPWDLPADVEKTNALIKWTGRWGDFNTRALLSYYDNEWNSTDQVPQRRVRTGALDRFGFVDPTLGGQSERSLLIAGLDGDTIAAGVYASQYKLNLFGNFTYFLEDPVNGDQHEQVDRRWTYGGYISNTWDLSANHAFRAGADLRFDQIDDANLYLTTARVRRQAVRRDAIDWLSIGGFGEWQAQWNDRLRSTVGLRIDYYDYSVDASLDANSGDGSDEIFLPSVSLAYEISDALEAYANWGRGFHSNDVRGVTISVDPLSGDPVDDVNLFVEQEGAEIGVRWETDFGLNASLAYFWLESDSELLFVGDSGSTEPSDGSERTGVEAALFWNVDERWTLDLNMSFVDSEFTDVPSGLDHIPNAHGRVIGAGITYVGVRGLNASLRLRHFGEAPLVEDDSVRHGSTSILNLGLGYDLQNWSFGVEILNITDADDDDIAYFFESALPGEVGPVEDVHFHPVVPRTVRFSLRYKL